MRTPEQAEALQQLYRVAEEAPEDLIHMRAIVEQVSCGTARCLLGWAIIDPWLQKNTTINDIIPADWSEKYITFRPIPCPISSVSITWTCRTSSPSISTLTSMSMRCPKTKCFGTSAS